MKFLEKALVCIMQMYLKDKKMVVFLEAKVLEDAILKKHTKFNAIRYKVTSFKEGKKL